MKLTIRGLLISLLAALVVFTTMSTYARVSASQAEQIGNAGASPGMKTLGKSVHESALNSSVQGCIPAAAPVPGPNRYGFDELYGTGGISGSDVWAVGAYYNVAARAFHTLVEHWDGVQWAHVPSPNPAGNQDFLRSVTAVSADDVWAIGDYISTNQGFVQTLTEHWDGTTWNLVPSPNLGGTQYYSQNRLYGVTAVSSRDVWAVGSYADNAAGGTLPLILHWDGMQWNTVPGPQQTPGSARVLHAVTAISSNDVWAVGSRDTQQAHALILHWDGVRWSEVSNPTNGVLYGVSAISSNDMWAVGTTGIDITGAGSQTVILHWDGTHWLLVSSPAHDAGGFSRLNSVVALSRNDIWAVGSSGLFSGAEGTKEQTLTEHWDGTQWNIVPSVDVDYPRNQNRLNSVTAFSGGDVWAVGGYDVPQTLVERWNGSAWSVVPSANPGVAANHLNDVAALSTSDIWAVGNYDIVLPGTSQYTRSLIEHWNGTGWSIVPSPNGRPSESILAGVSAASPSNIWTVGTQGIGGSGDYLTLIEHWDGTQWSIVPSPNGAVPGEGDNGLNDVAVVTANDVWAVGYSINLGPSKERALIEHWDGSSWRIVPTPDTNGVDTVLSSLTAISPNDIWAVGRSGAQALALHWDGTLWAIVPTPDISGSSLNGIDALSSNDIWAVGSYGDFTREQTLVLHWDGSRWSQVPSPSMDAQYSILLDVSVSASREVWTAGYAGSPQAPQALLLHWDGSSWNTVPVSSAGTTGDILSGVVALSSTDVWAVGSSNMPASFTLIAHVGRFSDALPTHYFYAATDYLAGHGIISGYGDCTFRPGNNTSRGQLSKMVSLSEGWQLLNPESPTFADVPHGSPFFEYIETAASHGVIGGYTCGNPESCDAQYRPYFRPSVEVTRGQLAKIVVLSKGWELLNRDSPTFSDVAASTPFYRYIETAYSHRLLGGYACGSPEACDTQKRPYFRPGDSATRGQIAKIIYNAVTAAKTP